jgi:hypothetical protein
VLDCAQAGKRILDAHLEDRTLNADRLIESERRQKELQVVHAALHQAKGKT